MPISYTPGPLNSLCDVPGIRVGHAQNLQARTGCTVVIPENGAVAGVDVRGSAPGTREIEPLYPVRLVPKVHAVLLTGGSAFGLDAAGGVQQYLEEKGIGFDTGVAKVPIVPAAVIFDLACGDSRIRPDRAMGYQAAQAAHDKDASVGLTGAGTGATVGKVMGPQSAMPGGLGQASEVVDGRLVVAALTVVNAFGDVIDPDSGDILAGARNETGEFVNTSQFLRKYGLRFSDPWSGNTTLCVVATNAELNKEEATKLAQMAHDGLARAIRPVHTIVDGDIVFALSCGKEKANSLLLGTIAAEVVSRSIVRAVQASGTAAANA